MPTTESFQLGDVVPMPTLPPVVAKYAEPVEPICVVEAYPSVVSPVTFNVEVAVIAPPTNKLPEKYPEPWTPRVLVGEVVPMPTLPKKVEIPVPTEIDFHLSA